MDDGGGIMFAAWMWLVACAPVEEPAELETQEALWLQGAYFNWRFFNHRVSALRFGFSDDDVEVGVIGGTSTTNTPADLEPTCSSATCFELPFEDDSTVRVGWGHLRTDTVAVGTATVALDVPQGGAVGAIDIELPAVPGGEVTALLTGFTVNTDRPLAGDEPACYRPEYGWHPRRFAIEILDVSLDEEARTGTVEVAAQFDPGPSLEAQRACIDDVFERSLVAVSVDVMLLVGV